MENGSAGKAPATTTTAMAYDENFMVIVSSFHVGLKSRI